MSLRSEDPERRASERDDLVRDLGRLGGALLAAVDTQGRPGLAWRSKHAAEHIGTSARRTTRAARREAKRAAKEAKRNVGV